jgi:hypothetical protein
MRGGSLKVLACLVAVSLAAVVAIDIDLDSDLTVEVEGERKMTVAFESRSGSAAELKTTTLMIDGKAAARLTRVDGMLSGSNAEVVMVCASLPEGMREWVKSFVSGKYKKRKVSIIAPSSALPTPTAPLPKGAKKPKDTGYSEYSYKGALIREVQFPAFGEENGLFKVRVVYQTGTERRNVRSVGMAETPVRSQFFHFDLAGADGSDRIGSLLGKSVFKIDSFSIGREGGFGKQSITTLNVWFAPTSSASAATAGATSSLDRWQQWYTKKEKKLSATAGAELGSTTRNGRLRMFFWSGSAMEARRGSDAMGQLKPLLELTFKEVTLNKLDSGDGHAVLNVVSTAVADHTKPLRSPKPAPKAAPKKKKSASKKQKKGSKKPEEKKPEDKKTPGAAAADAVAEPAKF